MDNDLWTYPKTVGRLDVTDEDVFHVIASLHGYLAEIGAVGPPAAG